MVLFDNPVIYRLTGAIDRPKNFRLTINVSRTLKKKLIYESFHINQLSCLLPMYAFSGRYRSIRFVWVFYYIDHVRIIIHTSNNSFF